MGGIHVHMPICKEIMEAEVLCRNICTGNISHKLTKINKIKILIILE